MEDYAKRKIEALTKGFLAAGASESDIPRLVEEHLPTAILIGDGEGGLQAEIRRADGSFATPATAKHLDSYIPPDAATRKEGMRAWIAARNTGVVDPRAVKLESSPPPAEPPKRETDAEQSARVIARYEAEKLAAKNPASNLPPNGKPRHEWSTTEVMAWHNHCRAEGQDPLTRMP